jgi:hypothetical protein
MQLGHAPPPPRPLGRFGGIVCGRCRPPCVRIVMSLSPSMDTSDEGQKSSFCQGRICVFIAPGLPIRFSGNRRSHTEAFRRKSKSEGSPVLSFARVSGKSCRKQRSSWSAGRARRFSFSREVDSLRNHEAILPNRNGPPVRHRTSHPPPAGHWQGRFQH